MKLSSLWNWPTSFYNNHIASLESSPETIALLSLFTAIFFTAIIFCCLRLKNKVFPKKQQQPLPPSGFLATVRHRIVGGGTGGPSSYEDSDDDSQTTLGFFDEVKSAADTIFGIERDGAAGGKPKPKPKPYPVRSSVAAARQSKKKTAAKKEDDESTQDGGCWGRQQCA
jgi:hypothetical protein